MTFCTHKGLSLDLGLLHWVRMGDDPYLDISDGVILDKVLKLSGNFPVPQLVQGTV